jgi:DMSO/TMAO reductase YedYZ molybdopterin-dependent catalytic subunit
MKRIPILSASVAGVLVTAPLVALFFLGWRWFGLPFVPFDLFDKLSRILPGFLIIHSIETMVSIISALHIGATAVVAKTAEQTMAIIIFVAGFAAVAGLFFVLLRKMSRSGYLAGLLLGFLAAILLYVPAVQGQTAQAKPIFSLFWIFVLMLIWGAALAWLRTRLQAAPLPNRHVSVEPMSRRQLLVRLGEASAMITVAGAVVGALPSHERDLKHSGAAGSIPWSENHPLPNADAAVKPAPGTRPELTPLESHYRIDINTEPPIISEDSWTLRITGLVERPMRLTLKDLRRYDPMHQFVTLSCISNLIGGDLIGTTRWTGASLQRILQDVRPLSNATHIKITAADDFYEVVALDTIRQDARVMLTYAWDGLPLAAKHGFPLRIYIPDLYGMKQPKWIQSIEVIDHPEEGYWVKRGWDAVARMRATSVIDTMASNMMIAEGSGRSVIPLGGIAHAGARGISKVQVRVDEGSWRDALLRTPLSRTTWVIWRYDWQFKAGRHNFTVRCFEGDGTPQIATEAPPYPSGATGLYSIRAML